VFERLHQALAHALSSELFDDQQFVDPRRQPPVVSWLRQATMAQILLVEDERTVLSVLTMVLQDRGHAVVEATSGEKAVEGLRTAAVDLVGLDMKLPRMSGQERFRCRSLFSR
jgi:PleD family two-component response regulator